MSSRYEGFGMVLLEAMSCGVPVVSFDCPYGPKSIIKENCGILVEPANVSELAEKIGELASDEQKRIFMGDNARKEVEKYKIENIINKWISII
jgi:glycosyltransferase involved in cell wall biosynthesis